MYHTQYTQQIGKLMIILVETLSLPGVLSLASFVLACNTKANDNFLTIYKVKPGGLVDRCQI